MNEKIVIKKDLDEKSIGLKNFLLQPYDRFGSENEDFAAIIYVKGGCSNGNSEAKSDDKSAWMYYIKTPDKEYEDHSNTELKGFSQNRMTLEAIIQAMTGLINLQIDRHKLLFVTDYNDLFGGITEWGKSWQENRWTRSKNKKIIDLDEWLIIFHAVEDYFSGSKVLFYSKSTPEFSEGMNQVTEFVNSQTGYKTSH